MQCEEALRQAMIDNPCDLVRAFIYADWLEENGRLGDAAKLREAAGFEKRVLLTPASDRRHQDPEQNYGVQDVRMVMALIGPRGAISFSIFTKWYLPHVMDEQESRIGPGNRPRAGGFGLSYHSKHPMFDGQTPSHVNCDYVGGLCYSDRSSLTATDCFDILLRDGSEGVWAYLREEYRDRFGQGIN